MIVIAKFLIANWLTVAMGQIFFRLTEKSLRTYQFYACGLAD